MEHAREGSRVPRAAGPANSASATSQFFLRAPGVASAWAPPRAVLLEGGGGAPVYFRWEGATARCTSLKRPKDLYYGSQYARCSCSAVARTTLN